MLGDIVPNKPVTNTAASGPLPPPPPGSYGASSFGPSKAPAAQPQQAVQSAAPQPPVAAPQPTPAAQPAAVQHPAPAVPAEKQRGSSKAPLLITLTGVVIFVGGVAGLFIYALSA